MKLFKIKNIKFIYTLSRFWLCTDLFLDLVTIDVPTLNVHVYVRHLTNLRFALNDRFLRPRRLIYTYCDLRFTTSSSRVTSSSKSSPRPVDRGRGIYSSVFARRCFIPIANAYTQSGRLDTDDPRFFRATPPDRSTSRKYVQARAVVNLRDNLRTFAPRDARPYTFNALYCYKL